MRLVKMVADPAEVWVNPDQVVQVVAVTSLKYVEGEMPANLQQTKVTLSSGDVYTLDQPLSAVLAGLTHPNRPRGYTPGAPGHAGHPHDWDANCLPIPTGNEALARSVLAGQKSIARRG